MSNRLTEEQKQTIIELIENGNSSRQVAKLVIGRESAKSTINDFINRNNPSTMGSSDYNKCKILFIDIETAPILGHLWSLWQNGIGLNQVVSDWYILSFTAKWADKDEIIYFDQSREDDIENDRGILSELWELLNEAEVVIGHNIKKFDIKKINARFILNGFQPPSTYRMIDTLDIAKRIFGFTSNKLEYLTSKLCTKYKKSKHKKFPGHELWRACLNKNPEAWVEMKDYNIFDVLSNQELYEVFMPWDNKLPNFDLYIDDPLDMSDWEKNGYHYTQLGKYQRYRNKKTGQQRRGRTNLLNKEKRKTLLSNII